MNTPLRVLIVEDSENDALLVIDELRDGGYELIYERVETREQMEAALERQEWDIIIADYMLPDFSGLEALEIAQPKCDVCPLIVVSGQIGEDVAVSAMKAGASDYVLKGNLTRLVPAVERELREARMRQERRAAQEALQAERERSHNILESITDGFYALDSNWRFTYVNKTAEQMVGSNWRNLKGQYVWDMFPELVGSPLYNELQRAMKERTPVTAEAFVERINAWVIVRAYPYSDGLAVYARDVTSQKQIEEALDAERRRLRGILDALPVAVFIADKNGRIVEYNEQSRILWGGQILGAEKISEYADYRGWWPETGERIKAEDWAMSRALTKGEVILGEMVHIQRLDGECRTVLNSAAPLRDAEGKIAGGVAIVQDITEIIELRTALERALSNAKKEEERARALEGIAEAGITTTNLQELLDTLVLRITETLKVRSCSIWMLDEKMDEFVARAEQGAPGLVGSRVPTTKGVAGIVYKERRPVFTGDAEHDPFVLDQVIKDQGVKSLLSVPLITRDKVVGMTRIDEKQIREFTDEEVGVMEAMASRAAQAIDNIKLYDALTQSKNELKEALERERQFSQLLQRALLPEKPSINHGYSVAVEYIPYYMGREIGGDFYDVFEISDNKAGIVIGDVSGKGLEAASLAAATRNTIHALVHETASAGKALARANSILCRRQATFETQFVTVFVVVIDLKTGEFNYASAGHPPAATYRTEGGVQFLKPDFQPPVCLISEVVYPESEDRLGPGDALILFTDGIAEARKGTNLFDLEGIAAGLQEHGHRAAEDVAGELVTAASDWAEGHLSDDAAVVVVKRQDAA